MVSLFIIPTGFREESRNTYEKFTKFVILFRIINNKYMCVCTFVLFALLAICKSYKRLIAFIYDSMQGNVPMIHINASGGR